METKPKKAPPYLPSALVLILVTAAWIALVCLPVPPEEAPPAEEPAYVIEPVTEEMAEAEEMKPMKKLIPLHTFLVPEESPAVTELLLRDGERILTGTTPEIIYFNQTDPRWSVQKYGTDNIGTHACGPTSMAIVVSSLTDTYIQPPEMAEWAVNRGHWVRDAGSALSIILDAAAYYGLEAHSFSSRDPEEIKAVLARGDLFVALMGPGHFTRGGHFIVLRGLSPDGGIWVADPNNRMHSVRSWDVEIILDELSWNYYHGGPLWIIYNPHK